jgi:hypothetical protein
LRWKNGRLPEVGLATYRGIHVLSPNPGFNPASIPADFSETSGGPFDQ